jgi:gamma-glutamylcyclotransferase (GGCT)/AIG2-like uncharacterized protein YtfP
MTRPTSASVRLFVYGSLRRGERHHDELEAAGATFLGEAETAPGYRLEAVGEYLALVLHPAEADVVQGELYEIPTSQLPALDAFEGDAYIRGRVEIRPLASGAAKPRHQEDEFEGDAYIRAAVKLRVPAAPEESLAYFKKAR